MVSFVSVSGFCIEAQFHRCDDNQENNDSSSQIYEKVSKYFSERREMIFTSRSDCQLVKIRPRSPPSGPSVVMEIRSSWWR